MDHTNKANEKALLQAARRGDLDECRRLVIDVQTDVNALEDENEIGWSPLLLASRGGNAELVAFLIRHGANVNSLSRSLQSALHAACWNGHEEVVVLLLSYGANVNAQNNFGQTPLHWACHYGHPKIVKLLLRHGADAEIRNEMGNTALDKAISMRRSGCARLLRKQQNKDPESFCIGSQPSTSLGGSRQECSESNVSVDVGDSLITVASPAVTETKQSWNKTMNSSCVDNSDTEASRIEVDISLIEVPLEKDPEELRCAVACSETEHEDDASAWSKASHWVGKIHWRKVWIIFWVCFLFAMVIFMAVGVAKTTRNGSTSVAVPIRQPSRSPTETPPSVLEAQVPTQSPVFVRDTLSPSVSRVTPNLPWMSRKTRSPTTSALEDSNGQPTEAPTAMVASSTSSPMSRPTNTPSVLSTVSPEQDENRLPSAQPTVRLDAAAPSIAPTTPRAPEATRAPFDFWG